LIWRACYDPIERACGWWEPGPGHDLAPAGAWIQTRQANPVGHRLLWSVGVEELDAQPPPGAIEIRWEVRVVREWEAAVPLLAGATVPGPWSLWLDGLVEKQNDDLAAIGSLLEQARASGCGSVELVSPEGIYEYRYRFTSLVRYLCDELRLKFAVVELEERPNADYLNRYFASIRCCRGLPNNPGKKLGL
jgi:hypothetical protein